MSDALSPFIKRVEAILSELSHGELKRRLLSHARELPASRREAFFELLESRPEDRTQATNLLSEIETFVKELESGAYFEGWGWDRDLEEERAFGDDSWAPTMDGLFAEAAKTFLAGEWSVAAPAYGRLLASLDLEEAFSGSEYPEEMLDTDLREARARYFRALYEATPPSERAATLRDALEDLGSEAWADFDLAAMADAHETPLTELESFLPPWIATLEAMELAGEYEDRHRVRVLAEATIQAEGTEGLARLARMHGDRHPLLYERWLDELMRANLLEEALDAAQEGAERTIEAFAAARLADRFAELAGKLNRPDSEELGRRLAWRKRPDGNRFLRLHQSLRTRDPGAQHLAAAELKAEDSDEYQLPASLGAMLRLLAEDLDLLLVATAKASPLGWSYGRSMGGALVPFLLVGASGVDALPGNPMLTALWRELASRDLHSSADAWLSEDEVREPGLSWEPLLMAAIARKLATPESRTKALNASREAAMRRIEAIVSGGHRKAYNRAAMLAVAVSEAMRVMGDRAGASAWLAQVRTTFPRHSAFKRELESAAKRSGIAKA